MSNRLLNLGITYREFVAGLFAKKQNGADGLMYAAAGIAGEGGEILDEVKKHWVYGKPLNREKILEEIGDELFYLTALCNLLGVSLCDCIDGNVEKLMKRYPNGYSDRAAIERADVAGRA